jgi:hypothetical protein
MVGVALTSQSLGVGVGVQRICATSSLAMSWPEEVRCMLLFEGDQVWG